MVWLGALASGAAWGASHGIEARPLLAAVALAPLLAVLADRRPFLLGWLSGTVAWGFALPWIVPTMTIYGQIAGWLAGLALLLLAGILGLYHGAFAWMSAPLWRRGDLFSLLAIPAVWVAFEVARGWLLTGFPWNLAAYAWTDVPGALPLSGWIGAWGVSALVVAVNLGVARAMATRRWEAGAAWVLAPVIFLALGARHAPAGERPAGRAPIEAPERLEPLDVRILQPNIPNRPYFDREANDRDYRRLLDLTERECAPGRLLVWPESAAWPRAWQEDPFLRSDVARRTRGGCALLLNTSWDEDGKTYNSVLLVSGGEAHAGPAREISSEPDESGLRVERADKRHLVPFGEYVPLRGALPFLGKIARTVGDFSAAGEIRLLERGAGAPKLGAAVCYEVVFPGETAALVRAGANVLVTLTNDAWYGDSSAPRQHLRAARFRAAENRRWLLRAAITGISAVVRPDGSLAEELGVGAHGVLSASVPPRTDRSPYTRAPWLVPLLAILVALGSAIRARRAPLGRRGPTRP